MAFSLTGGKDKKKSQETQKFDQTNTLSDRAAGMLTGGILGLQGRQYQGLDFNRVKDFQDPYASDVRDATMAELTNQRQRAETQQQSDFAGSGAFGDNRRGIYEAELDGQYDRTAASTLAGLNSANYSQALSAAMSENQGRNEYDLALEDLLSRYRTSFANEGRTYGNSSGTSKSTGYNMGFTGSPFGK